MSAYNDEHDDAEDMRSAEWYAASQLAIEQMHLNAVATQNPIYAWQAFEILLRAQSTTPGSPEFKGDRVVLPAWLGRYLVDVSSNICSLAVGLDIRVDPIIEDKKESELRLAQTVNDFLSVIDNYPPKQISAKDAAPLLGQALGLTRRSWSAFNNYASDRSDIETYHKVASLRDDGMSYEAALLHLANSVKRDDTNDVPDTTKVRRAVQHGAKLIAEQHRRKSKAKARQN